MSEYLDPRRFLEDRAKPDWWERRYIEGDVPWDTGQTPPEVIALVESGRLKRGWALDLGCGTGVTSRYLAAHGFQVAGVDLSLIALRRAYRAAGESALSCYFTKGNAADLAFLKVDASLAVDIGCFHNLGAEERASYVRSLAEHLIPGGYYLLYTFLRPLANGGESEGSGVSLADIAAFAPAFILRSSAHGEDRGRSSAWFLMQRG